jgi:hypothetical protein
MPGLFRAFCYWPSIQPAGHARAASQKWIADPHRADLLSVQLISGQPRVRFEARDSFAQRTFFPLQAFGFAFLSCEVSRSAALTRARR